jgi:hypothetical protein
MHGGGGMGMGWMNVWWILGIVVVAGEPTSYCTRARLFPESIGSLRYGKKLQVRDLVWFSTKEGCFAAVDPESIRGIREFEKTQKQLDKRWARVGDDPALSRELQQRQKQHTVQRDEFIWSLYDKLKKDRRLVAVTGASPPR